MNIQIERFVIVLKKMSGSVSVSAEGGRLPPLRNYTKLATTHRYNDFYQKTVCEGGLTDFGKIIYTNFREKADFLTKSVKKSASGGYIWGGESPKRRRWRMKRGDEVNKQGELRRAPSEQGDHVCEGETLKYRNSESPKNFKRARRPCL